jgi:IS5 family transposase
MAYYISSISAFQVEALYVMRKFMRLDCFEEGVTDAAALLKFRHLLETRELQKEQFRALNEILEKEGKMMRGGTVIDAAFTEALSSAKNSATGIHGFKKFFIKMAKS